jgi:hypothetical protein
MSQKDAGAKESAAMHDPLHCHNHRPHSISRTFSFLVYLLCQLGLASRQIVPLAHLSPREPCGSALAELSLASPSIPLYGNATSSALPNSAFLSERLRMILIPELKKSRWPKLRCLANLDSTTTASRKPLVSLGKFPKLSCSSCFAFETLDRHHFYLQLHDGFSPRELTFRRTL